MSAGHHVKPRAAKASSSVRNIIAQGSGRGRLPRRLRQLGLGGVARGSTTRCMRVWRSLTRGIDSGHSRQIEIVLLEHGDPAGPHGARGIGEPPTVPVAPAIRNAVSDAWATDSTKSRFDPMRSSPY